MLNVTRRSLALLLLALLVAATPAAQKSDKEKDEPPFHEYKGVRIGMLADEARKKLGEPADKGDKQDFYVFSDTERARVYYDKDNKARAVSVTYVGASGAPKPAEVIGTEIEAREDGSMHRMVTYPDAGYWVSYSRTAGDDPLTIITMQKMP